MPENQQKNPQSFSSVHTFKSDTEKFIKEEGKSLIKIAARQTRIKEKSYPKRTNKTVVFYFITAVLFLIIGGFAGFKIYKTFCCEDLQQITRPEKPFITIKLEEQVEFLNNPAEFINTVKNLNVPVNALAYIATFKKTNLGESAPITGKEFLEILKATPPLNFQNSLDKKFNLFLYADADNANNPILLFSVKPQNYDFAFSGMLEWEKNILNHLEPILPKKIQEAVPLLKGVKFKDKIIKNQDVRFLESEEGASILFYGFFNKKILVVTTSEAIMENILTRLLR